MTTAHRRALLATFALLALFAGILVTSSGSDDQVSLVDPEVEATPAADGGPMPTPPLRRPRQQAT